MNIDDQRHEATEMGCFLKTLGYMILSIFSAGFIFGIAVMATLME